MDFHDVTSDSDFYEVKDIHHGLNFCLVCASAAFGELQHELGEWTASSTDEQLIALGEDYQNLKLNFCADLKDFTCVVCKTDVFPPILQQCQNGHLACKDCSERPGVHCSECSRSISRIRNVALESILTSATVTCKYARMGCTELSSFLSRAAHERICTFEPKLCKIPGCIQAGFANRFPEHLKSKHNIDVVLNLEEDDRGGEYSLIGSLRLDFVAPKVALLTTDHQQNHHRGGDCYLLHLESTPSGDQLALHVTALEQARQRKYQIAVEISGEQTYCYKSLCTAANVRPAQQQPGRNLLVPKPQSGDPPSVLPDLKNGMLCRIRLE